MADTLAYDIELALGEPLHLERANNLADAQQDQHDA